MFNHISSHLKSLTGFIGYVEIDKELRLVENTTLAGDDMAVQLAGYFINLLIAYESAGRTVKTIAVACGLSVYVSLKTPNGYLIVQMDRQKKLVGMRRALTSIINEANNESTSVKITNSPVQTSSTEKSEIKISQAISTESVWQEFRKDFFKILSPVAPENILQRLLANAFRKSNLEETVKLDNSLIAQIVKATLDEIPNAARRKLAEVEASKLLKKYSIQN
jgi:hypothetical protein